MVPQQSRPPASLATPDGFVNSYAGDHQLSPPAAAPARRRGRLSSSTEWLTTERQLESTWAEWASLAEGAGNVFGTPEFVSVWWRHFGRGRRLSAVGCRSPEGRLIGLAPLYEFALGPITILRFIGHGAGDVLGPVCAPDDRQRVAGAVRNAVSARRGGSDLLLAERLPAEEGWSRWLGGRLVRHEPSPVLRIGDMTWDDFLSTRSRNFRQKLRRSERRLRAHGSYRVRLADDPGRLERDMKALIRLHNARWGASESQAFAGRRLAFHLDWAAQALAQGWLRLWVAEVRGSAIAAWYGFRFGGAEAYYQAGRDPSWERESVGFMLMCHSIQRRFRVRPPRRETAPRRRPFVRRDEGRSACGPRHPSRGQAQ
jgi:CelD/BcsL family acetyltransferase involved in cellulose biosynthesis